LGTLTSSATKHQIGDPLNIKDQRAGCQKIQPEEETKEIIILGERGKDDLYAEERKTYTGCSEEKFIAILDKNWHGVYKNKVLDQSTKPGHRHRRAHTE
jgi:hypothetical protein